MTKSQTQLQHCYAHHDEIFTWDSPHEWTFMGGPTTSQSTSSFETVFLLSSDICAEAENFLRQPDDEAHMRNIYFAFTNSLIINIIIFRVVYTHCLCNFVGGLYLRRSLQNQIHKFV